MNINRINHRRVRAALALVLAFPLIVTSVPSLAETKQIEEIVVTANRREQNPQDVAAGLQVFGGAQLDQLGADGFEDYLLNVSGASFRDQGNGAKRIALRGVSNVGGSDFGNASTVSPVGIYLNEVPIQGTSLLPDLGLYDLNRVEVLKGPQGTLYGEGTSGGAIRMILNSPTTGAFESKMDSTLSSTQGGGWNYQLRGATNIPLNDRVAIRLVGAYRDDEGFVDNVTTGEDNKNSSEAYSIRALLGARLTDKLSVEVMALNDAANKDGLPTVDLTLGDLQTDRPEQEFSDVETSIFGLTLNYNFGFSEFTSVTSYYENEQDKRLFVPVFAPFFAGVFGIPITHELIAVTTNVESFSQELRLVSSGDNRLDWIVGAFYRDKDQSGGGPFEFDDSELPSVNLALAGLGLPLFSDTGFFNQTHTDSYEQAAVYGEASFELTERLELLLGLRWYDEDLRSTYFSEGFGPLTFFSAPLDTFDGNDSGVIPKVAVSYKVSDDQLLYALASKGFRSGAPNFLSSSPNLLGDPVVESDSIWNYELGAKTTLADGRLQLNATLFYIDWSKIQTTEFGISASSGLPTGFLGNGGDAENLGAEIELHAAPTSRLRIGGTLGYADSELTKSTSTALVGSVLPNTPKWTASAYSEYRFSAFTSAEGFIRFDVSYMDEQALELASAATPPTTLEDYTIGNFRTGLEFQNNWDINLFVDNLGDERAQSGLGTAFANARAGTLRAISRPRTFGLTVNKNF